MRGAYLALATIAAIAAFTGGSALLRPSDAGAEVSLPTLAAAQRRDLTLLHVEGRALRGTPARGFAQAAPLEALGIGETLRTHGGATATLRLGLASRLWLEAHGELTALPAPAGELAFRLDKGRARVELAHPGRSLVIHGADGARVVAAGSPGTRFLVAAQPGVLAVANPADAAAIQLLADDAEVVIPAARAAWSVAGGAPTAPTPPPRDPRLEVTRVAQEPEEDLFVVTGRAHPLALVRAGGEPIALDPDGAFALRVPLKTVGPLQLLATLPTGPETILEVALPPVVETTDDRRQDRRKKRQGKRRPRRGGRGR